MPQAVDILQHLFLLKVRHSHAADIYAQTDRKRHSEKPFYMPAQ